MKRRLIRGLFGGGQSLKVTLGLAIGIAAMAMPVETENAVANGDTRTIQLYHVHTKESISATYLVNGAYDQAVLDKLNWFLRDWRHDEQIKMDPRLFDVIWEVYRESGSRQPIEVMSAYRSPETNAMLRRRSRGVAEHSQHILGKAMDQHYFDVPMSRIREIAMRLQRGGVGFYPTAGTPFVHMDVGGVRHWPRMSYDQLARLFPDGKTVHIPSNGQPLPGYEEARAELEARGDGSYPTATEVKSKGFFAWLFGSSEDEQEDAVASRDDTPSSRAAPASRVARAAPPTSAPVADSGGKSGGTMAFLQSEGDRAASATPTAAPLTTLPAAPPPANPNAQLALAMSMRQGASQAAIPGPAAPAPAVAPAMPSLAVPPSTLASSGLAVPTPPKRPVDLADASLDLPMPPVRPVEFDRPIEPPAPTAQQAARLSRADGISALLAGPASRGGLPAVITQGSSHAKPGAGPAVLAYASPIPPTTPSVPMPVPRPTDLVSARLDRSNFRALTSAAKSDKAVPRSAMGSSVVGIRAAARASGGTFAAVHAPAGRFGVAPYGLTTDRFTGAAMQPDTTLVTAKRVE